MKKFLSMVFAFCFIFSFSVLSFAEDDTPEISAKSAVLMDFSTGEVLFEKDKDEIVYPASVTKIMPLLLFMEALDNKKITLNEMVTAGENAESKYGSQIWLKKGEQMSVDDLLKATAVSSANDACTALGEHIFGSEEAFVKRMNERAAELSMHNTNFENCTGLDDETKNHVTTAYDVAIMSRELLEHDKIRDYTTLWMDSLRDGKTQLVNTNRLVRFFEGTTGLKTGTTTKAGHCLSASCERNGLHLIAVIMGAKSSDDRFSEAKALLNWGFQNFETFTPKINSELLPDIEVKKGVESFVRPTVTEISPMTLRNGESKKLKVIAEILTKIDSPVKEGQRVGKIIVFLDQKPLKEYNLVSDKSVQKLNIFIVMRRFLAVLSKGV